MTGRPASIVVLIKLLLISFALLTIPASNANALGFDCKKGYAPLPNNKDKCVPCGKKNQPECEPLRKGKQCVDGLDKYKGMCRAWGQRGEKAWPKSRPGFTCDKGLAQLKGVCVPCGSEGQPACDPLRKGKQCVDGLKKLGEICRVVEEAENKFKLTGFDCDKGYAPGVDGNCVPCSRKDQPACEPLRRGKKCANGLNEYKGICRAWGQKNEFPWPKERPGFQCDKELAPHNGKCLPCGYRNQPMCEAARKGPQCFDYLGETKEGICRELGGEGQLKYEGAGFDCKPGFNVNPDKPGYCTACGALNQPGCEPVRRGKRCDEGLKVENKRCVPDETSIIAKKVSEKATQELQKYLAEIVKIIVTARNAKNDSRTVNELSVAELNAKKSKASKSTTNAGRMTFSSDEIGGNPACDLGNFKSWSISAGADANIGIGASGEFMYALRCADHQAGQRDSQAYIGGSQDKQSGGGASAGMSVGLWSDAFDNLDGKSHGYTLSITSAMDVLKAATVSTALMDSLRNMKQVAPDVGISVWFARLKDDEVGSFQGISVSLSGGVGIDAGGRYSKASSIKFF